LTLKPLHYEYLLVASIVIKKLMPDIVIVHNRPEYINLLRKQLGKYVKIILYEHNHNLADMFTTARAIRILNNLDLVVEISEYSRKYDIGSKYADYLSKACVIPNAVDIRLFQPFWELPARRADLRKQHALEGRKVILFTGAIRKRKGIQTVVEAMEYVLKKHPDTVLVIAGGSAHNGTPRDSFSRKVLKKAASFGDNVRIMGFVPHKDIAELYLIADVFCAPSIWEEPFGLVFAEAMAAGLPVVSSKRGGIPEIVNDGENGLLVDNPEDPSAVADHLITLLEDDKLRRSMGEKGRERIEKLFTWKHTAAKLNKILAIVENKNQNKLNRLLRVT
jgi:spore coat protein SA